MKSGITDVRSSLFSQLAIDVFSSEYVVIAITVTILFYRDNPLSCLPAFLTDLV